MVNAPTLQFLGAAGTVTGSKFLVRTDQRSVLLDCGLFQGLKELRLRNWRAPAFDARKLHAVVLSHAHIDHSGYLPLVVRNGFRGPVFCTSGTADLLRVMLPDAAHLQEEEAAHANRYGYSKHKPALPLYTAEDAKTALRLVKPKPYTRAFEVTKGITGVFRRVGHILGAASIELQIEANHRPVRLVFSGDLGRWNQPIIRNPEFVEQADVLLLESTYGDRVHPKSPLRELASVINEAVARGGPILIPAFAVGRTQEVVWMIRRLEDKHLIPTLPVYVDSPMAIDAGDIYARHREDHNLKMTDMVDHNDSPLESSAYHQVRDASASQALHRMKTPFILVSASGMVTGGRILHHLKRRLPNAKTTVLFVGFQAEGTRGRALAEGAKQIKIHGELIPVRAKIISLDGFSAHADRGELLKWLSGFKRPPRQTYLVHGEPAAAASLAALIKARLGWKVQLAQDGQTVPLTQ